MKRTALGGLVVFTVISLAACTGQEAALQPAPITVTDASPVATTTPDTTPASTTPPTTAPPEKPVVTAVPVIVPIAKKEVVVTTPATTPAAASSGRTGDAWTDSWNPSLAEDSAPIQVGWVSIPKIGLSSPTFAPGSQWSQSALDRSVNAGPTFWGNQTLPGQDGNVILTGHRTSHGGPFRNIDQLTPGDEIQVAGFDGLVHVYVVESQHIVYPNDLWWVPPRGGPTLTLYSCHPPTSTRQRILVFANLKV